MTNFHLPTQNPYSGPSDASVPFSDYTSFKMALQSKSTNVVKLANSFWTLSLGVFRINPTSIDCSRRAESNGVRNSEIPLVATNCNFAK